MTQRAIMTWLKPAAVAAVLAVVAAGCSSGLPDSDAGQPGPPWGLRDHRLG